MAPSTAAPALQRRCPAEARKGKKILRATVTITALLFGRRACLPAAISSALSASSLTAAAARGTHRFVGTPKARLSPTGAAKAHRAEAPMTSTKAPVASTNEADGPPAGPVKRGAFILFEGVDRCGKTTQANLLVQSLKDAGHDACFMRFPDRTTPIGHMINGFLQNTTDIDDRCVHLLFSANRWEAESTIRERLMAGTTVVCDRYAYSGVAFSASKPGLEVGWCKDPDRGLPAPDRILFLDISVEDAMKRGQFGEERYEKEEFQRTVRATFLALMEEDKAAGVVWQLIDANMAIESIQDEVQQIATSVVGGVGGKKIASLWPRREG